MNDCYNSVVVKIAFAYIHFLLHRTHMCVVSMVFIMQNPYLQAGAIQGGKRGNGTYDPSLRCCTVHRTFALQTQRVWERLRV